MIVFSISDKGGTGRSVTSCNLAYRTSLSLQAGKSEKKKVAYLDFDLGSPTSGAVFELDKLKRGTRTRGVHSFLEGRCDSVEPYHVRESTQRRDLKEFHPPFDLWLYPGDIDGAEIQQLNVAVVDRCADLLVDCERDYEVTFVDLSAGRSTTLEMVLAATLDERLIRDTKVRWLIFHRWTPQHILATNGLVNGEFGLLDTAAKVHSTQSSSRQRTRKELQKLKNSIRYVRTAVLSAADNPGLRPQQWAWLQAQNDELRTQAAHANLDRTKMLGQIPIEPVLQWREQLILDIDVKRKIANQDTVDAFRNLADQLREPANWEPLEDTGEHQIPEVVGDD